MCKEAKILLCLSALYTFAMGLSSMFVNVFFWRQTSDFSVIVIYNLLHYATTPLTFILAGIMSKRKNGMWSLRIGLLLFASFYASILLFGNKGLIFIYMLGILYGAAAGFYWLAYNTLCFDFTCVTNRDTYNGINGSCCGVAAAVAPIISGYIISRVGGIRGYSLVFTMTLTLFVVLILASFLLRCKNYGSKLNFKVAFSRNSPEWGNIRKAIFIWGFRDVIIVFLINILIIETTNSEFSLGKFTLLAYALSSVSFMLVQRIIKPGRRVFSIFLGASFSFISILGVSFKVSYLTLLIYTILDAFFIPFFLIQMSSSSFNVISREHDDDLRIEYMINKDLMINSGRIISSIILLILVTNFKDSIIIRGYLLFISTATLIAGYFVSRLRNMLDK